MRVWPLVMGIAFSVGNFNSHTREGVKMQWKLLARKLHFNSHTREGVTNSLLLIGAWYAISTHTPVRVWHQMQIQKPKVYDFNSHTREGVTISCKRKINSGKFQLTHPWGCDIMQKVKGHSGEISTHTPVRVWRLLWKISALHWHFNSHTREGVTW